MCSVQKMFIKLKTKEFLWLHISKRTKHAYHKQKNIQPCKTIHFKSVSSGTSNSNTVIHISGIIFLIRNLSSSINSTFLVHKWHVLVQWHELVKNQCQMITEIFTEKVSLEIHCNTKYKLILN